jgi:TatD DNase family protein
MDLIDTHCHLTFGQLAADVEGVLERSAAAGVRRWITVGTDAGENARVVELAESHKNVYAAVGVHPHEAKDAREDSFTQIEGFARKAKVVAIGETGLDFHYDFSPRDVQKRVFVRQIEIASETGLPLIVHSREAFDETAEILDEYGGGSKKVVYHCFSGGVDEAKALLDKGYSLSFTGVLTFKNAGAIREAAKFVGYDRMMLETDCPYMSPEPVRKQKTNEPAFMVQTARFIAELKGVGIEELAEAVTRTSEEFFGLGAVEV